MSHNSIRSSLEFLHKSFYNTSKLIMYSLLVVITVEFIIAYNIAHFISFLQDEEAFNQQIITLGWIKWIWLTTGITLSIIGLVRKDTIDLRYILSSIGLAVILFYSAFVALVSFLAQANQN